MEIVVPPFAKELFRNDTGHPIVKYPMEVLRRKASPVSRITNDTLRLIDQMIRAMKDANGVGIAAPQLGLSQRVIVIAPPDEPVQAIINPEIVSFSEEKEMGNEGCLSIPTLYGDVERSLNVTVTGLNRKGKPIKLELKGYAARVAQHEVDHLDGVLFIDRADPSTLHWSVDEPDEDAELDEPVEAKI